MKFISIARRLRLWVVLGLVSGIGLGCAGLPTQPVVTPMVSEKENLSTPPEAKGRPFLTKTFVWTIQCEADGGQTCEGDSVLSFPSDLTYCRYDYQIKEGPAGKTEQVISVQNDSSIKVYIKAVGGPFWNSYKSKIELQVWGIGIAMGTDPETRRTHFCDPLLRGGRVCSRCATLSGFISNFSHETPIIHGSLGGGGIKKLFARNR